MNLPKPKTGIVITSYNHTDYTRKALDSFYSTINDRIDHELWLLDDNSSEDIESIYNKYKNLGLKFYKNNTNAGLTSLWNRGFELNRDKDYLIICNNDVIFSNHWADNLIDALKNSLSFSVAVPVTNAPGHIPAQHIANFVKNYIPNDKQNEINLISEQIKNQTPQQIKKANGFCLAVKVSLLSGNLLNGAPFNNKFRLYGAEDEFFSRVKPPTMIVPGSFIFHYKQVSVDRNNFAHQQYRSAPDSSINKFSNPLYIIRRAIRKILPRREYVKVCGSIIPSADERWCGPDFEDNNVYLRSTEAEADRLIKYFQCTQESRVLDVGCGQGRLPIGILRLIGDINYMGIDVHRRSIDWCKHYIERDHPSFQFKHLNLYNERYNENGVKMDDDFRFEIEPKSVDIIYLFSVFSHTTKEDMIIYLKDFSRILADKGKIFFTTFVEKDVPDVSINPKNYRLKCSGPLHIVRYKKDYLFSVLDECGYSILSFTKGAEVDGQSAVYLSKKND